MNKKLRNFAAGFFSLIHFVSLFIKLLDKNRVNLFQLFIYYSFLWKCCCNNLWRSPNKILPQMCVWKDILFNGHVAGGPRRVMSNSRHQRTLAWVANQLSLCNSLSQGSCFGFNQCSCLYWWINGWLPFFWLLSPFSFDSFHTGCVWMCEHCQQQAGLQIIFSVSMLWIVLHKY